MTAQRPYDTVKRMLDIVTALIVLILAAPILLVVTLLVLAILGRPVLFRQQRPGQDGHLFTLLKFRSMRTARPGDGLTDADRLTRFGRLLRASSLDELPSFVNVLRGEMSVIGPRPLLPSYLDRYTPEQARRHEVRPGITGLAQVSGRNTVAWERRFELDVRYVEQHSLRLDAWIVGKTVRAVVRHDGISADGHATMPEYHSEGVA